MKIIITIFATIVVCMVVGTLVLYKMDSEEYESLDKCKEIDSNFTIKEIMALMGQPAEIVEREHSLFYYYPYPVMAAEATYIVFNKSSRQILEIHCGEGHVIKVSD